MSDDNYTLIGPNGEESTIDFVAFRTRALQVAGRLAIASRDADEVEAIIATDIIEIGLPPEIVAMLTGATLRAFAVEIFAPMFTALQVEHLDTDFIDQLERRAGLTRSTAPDQRHARGDEF